MRVTGVEGQVLYGAGSVHLATNIVQQGQKLGPGTFSVGHDGILYLSAFDGSELRLSENGTICYDGDDNLCQMDGPGHNLRSNFHLIAGKVQIAIKIVAHPPHCYHVILPQASTSLARGGCVMCMHGGGTYLFVSSGRVFITEEHHPQAVPAPAPFRNSYEPLYGAVPVARDTLVPVVTGQAQILVGNGKVGVIGVDGNVWVEPLSALTAATQNCLLAGFNPNVVEGGGKKSTGPDPSDSPVSPTQ